MKIKTIIKKARAIAEPFRVDKGKSFRLKDVDPGDTLGFKNDDKHQTKEALANGIAALAELQDKLYAQDKWAVLLIFQAMDAAGKDGAIKHVMSGVNPQGCQVFSFKSPSAEELDHDYLWRCMKCLPNRGHIGIFNRSYYEETLVVRVHPEFLHAQKLPEELLDGEKIWDERYRSILDFEKLLYRNGTRVVKFFLHLSKEEQRRRFLERIDDSDKNWKFSQSDIAERARWKDYQKAYEACLGATSPGHAPWFVVPADDKENARLIISHIVLDTLEKLKMSYPDPSKARRKELLSIRKQLAI